MEFRKDFGTRVAIGCLTLCLSANAHAARISSLRKPDHVITVVLATDEVRIVKADRRHKYTMLLGFLAGRYVLAGSDKYGDYYLNEKPGWIGLMEKDIPAYAPGQDLPAAVLARNQYPRTLNNGGFYVQKKDGAVRVYPFYVNALTTTGAGQGLVGVTIVSLLNGTLIVERDQVEDALAKKVLDQIAAQSGQPPN